MHREPEVLEAAAQVGKWFDCRARITSKEVAPLHSVKNALRSFQDPPLRGPVAVQSGNECGVHRKFNATKKREAINHNFKVLVSMTGLPNSSHARTRSCSLGHFANACGCHVFPEPNLRKLHDGGHKNQMDGHIGSCEQKRAKESGHVVGEARV